MQTESCPVFPSDFGFLIQICVPQQGCDPQGFKYGGVNTSVLYYSSRRRFSFYRPAACSQTTSHVSQFEEEVPFILKSYLCYNQNDFR